MPAGYPAAWRGGSPAEVPVPTGPGSQGGSVVPFVNPANENEPLPRPPWLRPPPRGPWVPAGLGARLPAFRAPLGGIGLSSQLLQWAADNLASVLKDPGDYGYGLVLDCGWRAGASGRLRWANTVTGQCLGLQGWSIWGDLPVPGGVQGFTLIQEYFPFGAPDGAVYQSWNYALPGTAPGYNPGPFIVPVFDPLVDPNFQPNQAPNPISRPALDPYPSDAGYKEPGVEPERPVRVKPRRPPPNPKEKEKKAKALGEGGKGPAKLLQELHHAATEGLDALDAVWKALPPAYRTSPKCGNPGTAHSWHGLSDARNKGGAGGGGCYVTPQQKAKDLWKNWRHINQAKALRNLAINEAGDRVIGKSHGKASDFGNKNGIHWGFVF